MIAQSVQFSKIAKKLIIADRSLFIPGGGRKILVGITWFLGKQKKGISRNWEPKRRDRWKLWKDSEGGTTQFAFKSWKKLVLVFAVELPKVRTKCISSDFLREDWGEFQNGIM